MTKEEYLKEADEIEKGILGLRQRKEVLAAEFLKSNAEFKDGDKVLLTWTAYQHPFNKDKIIPEDKKEAFVKKVSIAGGNVRYTFWKVKRDGSKSQHELASGGYSKIELLEPAK